MRLTREQTEESVAQYVAAATRAAVDDRTPAQLAAHAREMIGKRLVVELWRATTSLWLA